MAKRLAAAAHPCTLEALADVADAAMCHGKAKLVSIDCEADGESGGALAALSVESDAAAMPLVHWTTRLALPAPTPQVVEPQASLAGALSRLSHSYCAVVRGPDGCHAILVTASSPPASQNWVQLEDGEGRDMVGEEDRDRACLSLLRREASKLAGQGVRFVMLRSPAADSHAHAPSDGLPSMRAPAAEADLYADRPLLTLGRIELSGHAERRDGTRAEMHLQLLLGHAGSVQGYLHAQSADGENVLARGKSDASGKFGGVEMRGTWNTMGQLTLVVSGDNTVTAANRTGLVDSGLVYSGVVVHGQQESLFRGTFGDSFADTHSGSEPAAPVSHQGEFEWRLGRNGAHQRQAWLGSGLLRTSSMKFLELHYKQRCELKLRGSRVKRRSLLQKMQNPRTFECVFRGIDADGSDRKGTVTVGAAAGGCSEEVNGFFLYQQGRLMASSVPIDVARGWEEKPDGQAESLYLGVVDMGVSPMAELPPGEGNEMDSGTERRGLEWMKELRKWQVVEGELQMVLAEYARRVAAEAPSEVGTVVGGESERGEVDGTTTPRLHDSVSSPSMAISSEANADGGLDDGAASGGPPIWINNGKGKVVDRSRCRIAGRGDRAGWRCPNPPMEGGGGLCALHCKKPKLPGGSESTSAPASPGPRQSDPTETISSPRQPRRIIRSSKLPGEDDSDGEQPSSRGPGSRWYMSRWGYASRAHRKAEERDTPWRQGDRAWIMDVAGVRCPIACLAQQQMAMEIESAPLNGTQSAVLPPVDDTVRAVADVPVGEAGKAGTESVPGGVVENVETKGSCGTDTETGKGKAGECDEDVPSEDDLDDGGLPTLDSVDLSLLGAQAQAKMSKPLAHKNVALTKVLLSAELAVEIYKCLPENRADHKQRSMEVSKRYGVAPKTIRDVWDRKTWYKATQHLWSTHTAHPARKDLPPPSPEVLLGTLVSDRRPNGTYLVKLDEHPDEVECNLGNLARHHPLTSVAADPAWAQAEALRRSEAEAAAAASAAAMAEATTGPRKHGRKPGFRQQLMTADGRSAAPGVGTVQGGLRPQRNTLEGRCRTVLARLLRSETTTNVGKVQEMLREDELKDDVMRNGGVQKDDLLVLDALQKVGERAERKELATFFEFWEDVLGVFRTLQGLAGSDSPLTSLARGVVDEFDLIFEDTFADDLARLRRAPGDGDENEVDGMDYFGLRVCVYNAGECRLQYGMVDDAADRSVHIMYDDEAEGWLNLPNKQLMILRPHEAEPETESPSASLPVSSQAAATDEDHIPRASVVHVNAAYANKNPAGVSAFSSHGASQAQVAGSDSAVSIAGGMRPLQRIKESHPLREITSNPSGNGASHLKAHVKLPVHVFQLGVQVEVLYDDGTWYLGRITHYNPETVLHRIVFDDGDWQEISLPDPDVRLAYLTSHGEKPPNHDSQARLITAEPKFKLGDIVWWQYTKGEWWPARVTSLLQVKSRQMRQELEEMGQPDEDSVLVHTFGDRTYAWVDLPPADVRGFGLHAELLSQRVSDEDNFERSVKEAIFLWQRQPASQRQMQDGRYLILEEGGPVVSNVVVEFLQPKIVVESNSVPSPPPKKPPASKGNANTAAAAAAAAAAKEAAAEATAAMKVGRIARGGGTATSSASAAETGGADGGGEGGKKRGWAAIDDDDAGEFAVGGWRIAQAMEAERKKKEGEAREQRLAAILERMSHQELLTALSLLGVALTRDQAVGISKLVAAKLSELGFGKAVVARSTEPITASTVGITNPDVKDEDAFGVKTNTAQEGDMSAHRSQSPPPPPPTQQQQRERRHGQVALSPSPPPPPPAIDAAPRSVDGSDSGGGGGTGFGGVGDREGERAEKEIQYIGVVAVEAGWSANVVVEGAQLHLGTFLTAKEAAVAYDTAVRLYLGEDAACNFAAARAGSAVPGDLILGWWSARDGSAAGASMATVACIGNHCTNGGPQEVCLSDSVEMNTDNDTAAGTAKRHRDVDLESADAHGGLNGLKRPKPTPVLGEHALEEGGEWNEAEWAAFRKRLARETAAADATEASIRRSQLCCRQVADEVKRREGTYRDTLQRWAKDQQKLAWWQNKMESMLVAIGHVQSHGAG